jgi:prophage antirepressor-like protein
MMKSFQEITTLDQWEERCPNLFRLACYLYNHGQPKQKAAINVTYNSNQKEIERGSKMMNGIQLFNYQDHSIRVVEVHNEPWWVLKDVCDILGMGSPHKVADRLDEDEKGRKLIPTPGGNQNMTIINESGLYNVILRSDKPEAKPFRKWVTSEVLPAIRKHGFYMTQEAAEQSEGFLKAKAQKERSEAMLLNAKARMLKTLCSVGIGGQQLSDVSKQVLGIKLAEKITGKDMGRYLPECEETYSATQIGKMFGISASRVGRIANANGLKTPKYGIRVMDKSRHSEKEVISFRYNQAAVERFQEILQDFETMW